MSDIDDIEYAIEIYRAVFKQSADINDIYFQGVFDALANLPNRSRLALWFRYHEKQTHAQIGENLGISGSRVGQIILSTLFALRHIQDQLRVSLIVDKYSTLKKCLEEKETAYGELYDQMVRLFNGEAIDEHLQKYLKSQQIKIEDLGLTGHITNALVRADIVNFADLLSADYNKLRKIRSIGYGSIIKIANRMHALGYTEWSDKINQERRKKENN